MNIKKMREVRKDVCTGCATFVMIDGENTCKIPHKKNGKVCPCSKCLIKMVCEDICDEALQYSNEPIRKKKLVRRKLYKDERYQLRSSN